MSEKGMREGNRAGDGGGEEEEGDQQTEESKQTVLQHQPTVQLDAHGTEP